MRIKWGSATDLATNFKREFLKENSKDLTISIDKHSPSANLLSVAKLLAFIRALTNDYGYEVCVEIEDSGIKKSAYLGLVKLGFPALLAEIGVICKVTRAKKSARESSTASGEAESFENAVANEKYESVIVPLSQFQFEISEVSVKSAASDRLKWVETETDKLVSGIVSNVNAYLGKRINVRPEFACSVLPVLRELVQNCLQHSPVSDARRIDESELRKRSHMIVYAITMSREPQPKYVRTSRPGSSLVGWEDKLDVILSTFH